MPQDAPTFAIAVAGLVLSIFNTWRQHTRDKIRLRIFPTTVYDLPSGRFAGFSIEVVNISNVDVSITEVAFDIPSISRRAIAIPFPPNPSLPYRLEARTRLRMAFPIDIEGDKESPLLREHKIAYATTACGKTFREKPARISLVNKLRAAWKKSQA